MIEVPRRYRYTVADRDRHGRVRVYLRLPGKPKVRLREEPGTDAFDAEYRRAIAAPPQKRAKRPAVGEVAAGSIDALCASYYGSAAFKGLDSRTQRVRKLILDRFRVDHGSKPAAKLLPRHLEAIRDGMADRPEAANGLLKALRQVFAHGVQRGLVPSNPAAAVRYQPGSAEGFHAWTPAEVAQFEAHWPIGSKPRLALALLLYTGQRRSDVVAFGRQHVREGWLHFTQAKNARRKPVRLALPIIPQLQRIIDATPSSGLSFLESDRGQPYTPASFGNAFRRWCSAAGLPHCSAHGVRKATAGMLAELGCSAHEIQAVTGHRTLKEVARYTAGAAQRVMAKSAMARLSAAGAAEEKVPPGVASTEWDGSATQPLETEGTRNAVVPRGGRSSKAKSTH